MPVTPSSVPHAAPRRRPAVLVLGGFVLALLAACADPDAPGPGAAGPDDEPAARAPACDDLDDGLVQGDRDATAEVPPEDTGDLRSPAPQEHSQATLAGDVRAWADAEAPDAFAGLWLDDDALTVAFADAVDDHREQVHARFGDDVRVVGADHSYAELEATARAVGEELGAHGAADQTEPGAVLATGIRDPLNRVTVLVVGGDDDALAALAARHGADRICLEVVDPPEPPPVEGPVVILAKAEGWRDGLDPGNPYALLEIADDRDTAELAWDDNVPDGLPAVDADRSQPGLHGSLEDVDFDREALVVWSSGESSSCPAWVSDIDSADGEVRVSIDTAGEVCTSDYRPYRLLLAVDRGRLPDADDLPTADVEGVPDGEVRAYEPAG